VNACTRKFVVPSVKQNVPSNDFGASFRSNVSADGSKWSSLVLLSDPLRNVAVQDHSVG
jgi:hypothetical protein